MTLIPPVALTTVQIVSGLAASAKNAYELAKGSSDRDLKGAVSELYDAVLETKARVLDLDEQVRTLKAQLAQREEIEGPDEKFGYFYFKSKPDRPLCPKCYQSIPSNVVHMKPPYHSNSLGTVSRTCPICNFAVTEQKNTTIINRGPVGPWG